MGDRPAGNKHSVATAALLAAARVPEDEIDVSRARRRLDDAKARWTPAEWAKLRRELGIPPAQAA